MPVRAHGVRRLVFDGLATEELRLSRAHDQHEDQTDLTTLLFKPFSAISSTLLEAAMSDDEGLSLESVILHDVLDPGVILQPVHRKIFAVTGVLIAPVRHLRL